MDNLWLFLYFFIRLVSSCDYTDSTVEIHVNQLTHSFPFGTAVTANPYIAATFLQSWLHKMDNLWLFLYFFFRLVTSCDYTDSTVEIHVNQLTHSFPFGTAVNANPYNDNSANGLYRQFIHDNFNWAVLENSLKWRQVEWNQVGYLLMFLGEPQKLS